MIGFLDENHTWYDSQDGPLCAKIINGKTHFLGSVRKGTGEGK